MRHAQLGRTDNDTAICTLRWMHLLQIWRKVSCSICKPGTEKGNYYGKEEDEEEEENIPLPGRNSGKINAAPSSLSEGRIWATIHISLFIPMVLPVAILVLLHQGFILLMRRLRETVVDGVDLGFALGIATNNVAEYEVGLGSLQKSITRNFTLVSTRKPCLKVMQADQKTMEMPIMHCN